MKRFALTAGLIFCLPAALLAQMRELSFYEVQPKKSDIVLDGKLDEAAWKDIPVHRDYYEYFKSDPRPSPLKTEFRMVYDDKGLYMAVINYDDHTDKLKREVTEFDNGWLWTDDCGEFYFDTEANGLGYTKFTINANAARADMRRLDTAVTLEDWSGAGWLASASVNKDSWVLEVFFPWEDLGAVAKAASLWQFCHARYAYSSGKFVGAASSPGGNYAATDKFGYLYFSTGKEKLDPMTVGRILATKARPPWCIPCGEQLISCSGAKVKADDLTMLLAQEKEKFHQALLELDALNAKDFAKTAGRLRKNVSDAEAIGAMPAIKACMSGSEEIFISRWKILVNQNFN